MVGCSFSWKDCGNIKWWQLEISEKLILHRNFHWVYRVFQPSLCHVVFRPVGMPFLEQVVVHNTDSRNDLHLLSISGSTVHFHCSFFQEKVSPLNSKYVINSVWSKNRLGHS